MFWAQALLSFGLWVGYGVLQARRAARVRAWASAVSPTGRGLTSAGLFVAGAAAMLGGLVAVAAGHGLGPDGMAFWAWLLISLAGVAFVHAQTLAMALIVVSAQEAVTRDRLAASEDSERVGISSDEKSSP